ncbi:Rab-family small GTPase RabX2B (macronuclear) [Tetrahymena thermophila SB210]|uniref:Rab-family small GTPase RabX2B n=2 Tax=Tetrahymena thermophila TaxID=5911 RepID=Q247U8_TETTS|nr:Rab-family small GTPase RabX2B [Tetrahymena thermophila SB210]EAS04058.2 Rab-family small GTPase RabX2B [Tetrahymena thermophila SB210]BAJ21315.1 Rab-family small GTPase RabX2A [Tetrahymena thermophila]|eukprot:XP_001024303.2 Rab-family small GTPase RabX2B [Tetrahymena thermophila SB210]
MKQNLQTKEILLKIFIDGEPLIGKQTLIKRFIDDEFVQLNYMDKLLDFNIYKTEQYNQKLKIMIFSYRQQGCRFKVVTKQYHQDSTTHIFAYDITNRDSFDILQERIQSFMKQEFSKNMIVFLIGLKKDLSDQRQVQINEAKQIADSFGMNFFEISSKQRINVFEMFDLAIRESLERFYLQKNP